MSEKNGKLSVDELARAAKAIKTIGSDARISVLSDWVCVDLPSHLIDMAREVDAKIFISDLGDCKDGDRYCHEFFHDGVQFVCFTNVAF